MSDANTQISVTEKVATALPYLRRYARALTGNQASGDAYAVATLEAVLEDVSVIANSSDPKAALFRAFHVIWKSSGAPVDVDETGPARSAQDRMAALTPDTREALLLHTVEEFSFEAIGYIVDVSPFAAEELVSVAYREMKDSLAGRVMIIEDEAIIALDLEGIVLDMGHTVTGVARTHIEATKLFGREKPDLILSDIQLADGSSGLDAVNEILGTVPDVPVVFITAFPERLLTGERPEPAFVITKPYTEAQVQSAVSQALFFSSTETLTA